LGTATGIHEPPSPPSDTSLAASAAPASVRSTNIRGHAELRRIVAIGGLVVADEDEGVGDEDEIASGVRRASGRGSVWQVEAVARVIGIESGEDHSWVGLGSRYRRVVMKMIAVGCRMVVGPITRQGSGGNGRIGRWDRRSVGNGLGFKLTR